MCATTCTHMMLLSDPGILLMETPLQQPQVLLLPSLPAASFWNGSFRWERNQKENLTGFLPETENASREGSWILRN